MVDDKEKRGGNTVYRILSQDLYATALHGDQVGIRQDEQWRARSRQFTADSVIVGKIDEAFRKSESDPLPRLEKVGFITIRDSLWGKEKDESSRRFVVKLFSTNGSWLASGEEMSAEEYANSYAAEEPQLTLAVLSKDNEIVTYIRQAKRGTLSVESFSFYLPGPDGSFEVFNIVGKRATLGDDFRVTLPSGNVEVAEIDSKFADIGGQFVVTIRDKVLAQNELFCRVLQCFSVAIRYRADMKHKLERVLREWFEGKRKPFQHRHELSLLVNPRRLTLKKEELEEV